MAPFRRNGSVLDSGHGTRKQKVTDVSKQLGQSGEMLDAMALVCNMLFSRVLRRRFVRFLCFVFFCC